MKGLLSVLITIAIVGVQYYASIRLIKQRKTHDIKANFC